MIISKYSLYCETEAATVYTPGYLENVPTVCPNNVDHVINQESIAAIDTIDTSIQEVEIEEGVSNTGGKYQAKTYCLDVSAGDSNGVVSSLEFSFPFSISLKTALFGIEDNHDGDEVRVKIAPNTIVGVITEDVSSGSNSFKTSLETFSFYNPGFHAKLFDGINEDDLGIVISKDEDNLQLTCENSAINNFQASSPTYIKSTVDLIPQCILSKAFGRVDLGRANAKGTFIPADTTIKVEYTNFEAVEKTFCWIIEYFY